MNLPFQTIKTVLKDGVPYYLQKVDVTDNPRFWAAWRYAKSMESIVGRDVSRNVSTLSSCITLTKMPNGRWYAFRLLSSDSSLPMAKFPLSYVLRDRSKLLPYQPEAVAFLCNSVVCNGAGIDGSDCGIGKTYHAIAVARDLGLRPAIIARKSGLVTWDRVSASFGISPLFVVSWESAKNGKFDFAERVKNEYGDYWYRWNLPQRTLLIFDECHMACNEGSQNYALWQSSKGRASLSLSATFADRPSRLKGLLNILSIVTPDDFDKWLSKRGHFTNRYNEQESLNAVEDMKEIHKILYPKFGVRLSDDHPAVKAFFPEAKYATELVYIGDQEQREQNILYKDMLAKVELYRSLGKQAEALVADLRYRQATELLKADTIIELVDDYRQQGKAVCVFVNFRETLRYLAEKLMTRSLIFGNQERYGLKREEVIDAFQSGKTDILLSMVSAGGQSISLHDLQGTKARVSLVCPTYDPIALQQVFGRTHRSGSKSRPIIKLVYAANTIEEKVAQSVNEKINNIKALNDGDLMEPDLFKLISSNEREVEQ
jgi:superfamily II DNA or RNA helicase